MKMMCERLKHWMLLFNIALVICTVTPYMHMVGIEPVSHRCVNFSEAENAMVLTYTWFTFIFYSLLPIGMWCMCPCCKLDARL